jgi:hypothetical protein
MMRRFRSSCDDSEVIDAKVSLGSQEAVKQYDGAHLAVAAGIVLVVAAATGGKVAPFQLQWRSPGVGAVRAIL